MSADYSKIKKLVEIEDVDEANEYLEKGWVLITSHTYMPYTREIGNLRQVYSLGFPGD